ncbi:MAG: hypothetical protein IPM42_02555 [Saprospiraceae bacterium]|nr:hypothetical protein [Saprospiraceae bacterium]
MTIRSLIRYITAMLTIIVFQSTVLSSQDNVTEYYVPPSRINFIDFNVSLIQASGALKTNLPNLKFGLDLGYMRQFKPESPLFWGFNTYYTHLGNRSAVITEFVDNILIDLDYNTNSQLLGFNGVMRFYPDIKLFKAEFFGELLLGYKWFFTTTSKTIPNTEDVDLNMERGRLSFNYGVSVGCNIPLSRSWYGNVRLSFLPGQSTSYYVVNDENNIRFSSLEAFTLKNSATDLLRWDIGVTFAF